MAKSVQIYYGPFRYTDDLKRGNHTAKEQGEDENRNAATPAPRRRKVVRRRIAKDKEGNVIGEEIIEEELED